MINATISDYTNQDSLENFVICQNPDCQEIHENIPMKSYSIKIQNKDTVINLERKEKKTDLVVDGDGNKYYEMDGSIYKLEKNREDICLGLGVIEEIENKFYCNNCSRLIYREYSKLEEKVSNMFENSTGEDVEKALINPIEKESDKKVENNKTKTKTKTNTKANRNSVSPSRS